MASDYARLVVRVESVDTLNLKAVCLSMNGTSLTASFYGGETSSISVPKAGQVWNAEQRSGTWFLAGRVDKDSNLYRRYLNGFALGDTIVASDERLRLVDRKGDFFVEDGTLALSRIPIALPDFASGGIQLFHNSSGASDKVSITLSESAAGMSRVVIYFLSDDGCCSSIEARDPDGKTVNPVLAQADGSQMWIKTAALKIMGTMIQWARPAQAVKLIASGVASNGLASGSILVTEVRGWRK